MIDLTNKKFHKLTVLSFHHKDKNKRIFWLCRCDCGKEKIVRSDSLKDNSVKSCGCYHDECHKTHGIWSKNKRLYKIFNCMHKRCYDIKNPNYKYYGGRGITVCEEWKKDNIEKFYNWAINNGYKDNLTIDRIDINRNYCPENCRWITLKEQANNKRNNHLLCYKEIKHTIAEWSEILNIRKETIYYNIKRNRNLDYLIKKYNRESFVK